MTTAIDVGFAVLYSWRLKPGYEPQFIDSWTQVTLHLLGLGSFGSRLHQGPDGVWYAYAQWPSSAARDEAFSKSENLPDSTRMADAILESFPAIYMEPVADYLVLPLRS